MLYLGSNYINSCMAKHTKDKILDIALKMFSEKGFASVSVEDVADIAGIKRPTVYYYFKTRELLYEETIKLALKQILPSFKQFEKERYSVEQLILIFIDKYIATLQEAPSLLPFLIYAINNNTLDLDLLEHNTDLEIFYNKINRRISQRTMTKISPQHVLILILSLCSYPIMSKNLTSFSVGMHSDVYDSFLVEQRNLVVDFVLRGLELKPIH